MVVHCHTTESVVSVFQRGMVGVHPHGGQAHLHRDLAKLAFRSNRRTALTVTGAELAEDRFPWPAINA